MNQIIYNKDFNQNYNLDKKQLFKNKKTIYLLSFIILIIIILFISCYIIYNKYTIYKKSLSSSNALNAYNISTLYPSSNNYNAIQLSNNISIIGLIEIPRINATYPIFSDSTEDLLKISVCRFSRTFS